MIDKSTTARIGIILLFALTFTTIGWTAPVLYGTYAPADNIVDVHSYEAQNTTTESNQHYVCIDRTVTDGTSADVITELYLLNEDGERISIGQDTTERYYEQGRTTVIIPRDLPDDIEAGTYRYVSVSEIDTANGRVTREFAFTSDEFTISEGAAVEPTRPDGC